MSIQSRKSGWRLRSVRGLEILVCKPRIDFDGKVVSISAPLIGTPNAYWTNRGDAKLGAQFKPTQLKGDMACWQCEGINTLRSGSRRMDLHVRLSPQERDGVELVLVFEQKSTATAEKKARRRAKLTRGGKLEEVLV
jgi:hypothetical protein